MAFKFAALSVF